MRRWELRVADGVTAWNVCVCRVRYTPQVSTSSLHTNNRDTCPGRQNDKVKKAEECLTALPATLPRAVVNFEAGGQRRLKDTLHRSASEPTTQPNRTTSMEDKMISNDRVRPVALTVSLN